MDSAVQFNRGVFAMPATTRLGFFHAGPGGHDGYTAPGLPLLMSFRGPQERVRRSSCMKTVWLGQALGAVAAVAVLTSAQFAPYATVFGLLSYAGCAFVLLRQFRAASIAG